MNAVVLHQHPVRHARVPIISKWSTAGIDSTPTLQGVVPLEEHGREGVARPGGQVCVQKEGLGQQRSSEGPQGEGKVCNEQGGTCFVLPELHQDHMDT